MSEALRKLLNQGNPQQPVITPHVGILTLHFQLYACEDLKAKRKAFTAMKAIWGKEPDLAVAETADQDALDCATWTIAALGGSSQQISQRLDQIEKAIPTLPYWTYTGRYSDPPAPGSQAVAYGFTTPYTTPPQGERNARDRLCK